LKPAGRHLLRVKDTAQNIRIGQSAADPLQRIHLEIALEDVRVQRREFVRTHVDVDADIAQILLDDRGLQPWELEARRLVRQRQTRARAVCRRIGYPPRRAALSRAPGRSRRRRRRLVRPVGGGSMLSATVARPRRR
jgi:hypothetical protein